MQLLSSSLPRCTQWIRLPPLLSTSPVISVSLFASPSPQENRAELQPNNAESAQVLPITPQTGALFWGLSPKKPLLFMKHTEIQLRLILPCKFGQQVERLITRRQHDHTNFISLGNQANRNNSEKYSTCIDNTVWCLVSVQCEAVVTVKSSNRKKRIRKENNYLFSHTKSATDGAGSKITCRS